jgi:uncharacterized SAM-binding protein YcdF (DUF218 family)
VAVSNAGSDVARRSRLRWFGRHRVVSVLLVLFGLMVAYYVVTFAQVRIQAGRDEARPADAIMVLGAAQYDGQPSGVLQARLSHALDLWKQGLAPIIVVTGGKVPGDRFTEAGVSAQWLLDRGVPDEAIRREVQGRTSWESIAASARFLKVEGRRRVLLVSDPYHSLRIRGIAREVGLTPFTSPTRTSPQPNVRSHELKEAAGVAMARFIGYRRLLRLTG